MTDYQPMPPESGSGRFPGSQYAADQIRQPPKALQPVIYLLLINLGLSILLTLLVFAFRHSVVNFQVSHTRIDRNRPIQPQLNIARTAARVSIYSRAFGNIVVAVVYWFLVRSLLNGKRRAYRRVLLLSILGIVSLIFLWTKPYPNWIRAEQVIQSLVLAAILYQVTRPDVRSFFAKPKT